MIRKAAAIALILGSSGSAMAQNNEPNIRLKCFNPPLEMPFHRVPNQQGKAGTYNVQFNVNSPAAPGTVFVDGANDAICNIVSDRQITAGRFKVIHLHTNVIHAVQIEFQHIEEGAPRFILHATPGTEGQGIVTLRFEVDYQ